MAQHASVEPEAPAASDNGWRQRFRAPRIAWARLARAAPERGLAATNRTGIFQLYAWDVPTGELRRLTDRPEGLAGGVLSPDGRHVYYFDDTGGNEVGHVVRIPFAGGEPVDVTPDLPPYSTFGWTVSHDGTQVALTIATADGYQLVAVDLGPGDAIGPARVLHRDSRLFTWPVLSPDGALAVVGTTERAAGTQHYNLVAFDTRTGERIAELWDGPESSLEAVAFAPPRPSNGSAAHRLLAATNRSGAQRPLIWHPSTGQRIDLDVGELAGDVDPLEWSFDGERLLLIRMHQAVQRLMTYDLPSGELSTLDHPSGSYGAFFAPDGSIYAQWQDATHPQQIVALDGATGKLMRTLLPAGEVPPGRPWRSVSFRSSDGQEIQGWLGVPAGDGPFPTILETHGGPESVVTEYFHPQAQTWLDQGFAFLTINYRGSTTFGRAFQEKIWGDLGRWEVEDMAAARDWLVAERIARPDQVIPAGWSYGGYLTLLALGKRPELWAAGIAGIAIADWTMLYEDSADVMKGYCAAILGGTPAEKPEQYAASSPITYAAQVTAPVLIIQGRNDARTPARPIQVYEARLRELGKPVEVHWFETGHGGAFIDAEQGIRHMERMLAFARRVLAATEEA